MHSDFGRYDKKKCPQMTRTRGGNERKHEKEKLGAKDA